MKTLLLLPLLAFSAGAEDAPPAPPTEVSEEASAKPSAPPRPSLLDDRPSESEAKAEPRPEPKPAKQAKSEAKAVAAPAKTAGIDEEYAFARGAGEDPDGAISEAAIEELGLFARRYPDALQAPDAVYLRAVLMQKKGDWQPALAALLRLIHEYPGSKTELRAKSAYLEIVDKKASRRQRPILNALVSVPESPDKAARLSALWRRLVEQAPDAVYEPAAEEIRSLFARFPDLKDGDRLQAALARLHAANGRPQAALVSWRRLLALFPASPLRPAAQLAAGDLYAAELKDSKKAIDAYQELVEKFPDAAEVLQVLERSAQLFDERLRQYGLAVEMNERIVKTFPKTPASLKALKATAKLQRDRLGASDEAVKTLLRLSQMHGGQDGVDALLQAADVARRDLKDFARQAELLRKVSDDYAGAQEAPQALYDAAGVYESDLKDGSKAADMYKEVAGKFPSHKLAKRAAERSGKLTAK